MYNFKISELIFMKLKYHKKKNLILHCFLSIKCENRVTISVYIYMYSQFIFNRIFTQFKCEYTYTHCHSLNWYFT